MQIKRIVYGCGVLFVMLFAAVAAQQPAAAPGRVPGPATPPLIFREAWKQRPDGQQHPVTPDVVSNPRLELKLYGASAKEILVTGTSTGTPGIVWLFNGLATTPVAVALRHRDNYVDLSGAAKIRWTIRTSGFHAARPVVKLADGTWLIGDRADVSPNYFNEIEFSLATIRWLPFDIDRVVTKNQTDGRWIDNPDLTRVDEVGYADLMPGSGHGFGGWASLGPMAVYGTPVTR
jgi:hypothetical protein